MTVETTLETLAGRVLHLRAQREALKRKYEAEDAVFTDEMEAIELEMRNTLQALGAKSVRTRAGTIILQDSTRYWPSDWEAMYRFIQEHAAFHLLEKRLHMTNITKFLGDNPGEYPPGLNVERESKAVVRKANAATAAD